MKSKKTIAIVTAAVLLVGGITAFVLTNVLKSDDSNDSSSLTAAVNDKTYDENNIGEIYYSPVDESHVATDENGIKYADNEVLVVADEGVTKKQIVKLARKYGAEVVGYIEQTGDYQWKMSDVLDRSNVQITIDNIKNKDNLSYIHTHSLPPGQAFLPLKD